jgi:hypothetical protein
MCHARRKLMIKLIDFECEQCHTSPRGMCGHRSTVPSICNNSSAKLIMLWREIYIPEVLGQLNLPPELSGEAEPSSGALWRSRAFSRALQSTPECSRVLQSASECFRVLQSASECFRGILASPEPSRAWIEGGFTITLSFHVPTKHQW